MILFCIPYAGGSSFTFNRWGNYLDNKINLIPLELAGRGRRFQEELYSSFREMVDDLYALMLPHIKDNVPFAVFGHSMGAAVVYELAERLEVFNVKHLFISAFRPPHLNRVEIQYETDKEMVKTLMKLGGTPRKIVENQEFKDVFFPIIRRDFENLDAHYFKRKIIKTTTTILHGMRENYGVDDVVLWNEYFNFSPNFEQFDEGHFFIEKFEKEVVELVNNKLIEHIDY